MRFFDLTELDRTPPQQGFPDDAVRAWAAHVAAGRISTPAAEPAPDPQASGHSATDHRLASPARILGQRA